MNKYADMLIPLGEFNGEDLGRFLTRGRTSEIAFPHTKATAYERLRSGEEQIRRNIGGELGWSRVRDHDGIDLELYVFPADECPEWDSVLVHGSHYDLRCITAQYHFTRGILTQVEGHGKVYVPAQPPNPKHGRH